MNISKKIRAALFAFVGFYLFILCGFLLTALFAGLFNQLIWFRVWIMPMIPSSAIALLTYSVFGDLEKYK